MNPDTITQRVNPVDDTAYADAWSDTEGRATLKRIVATGPSMRPRGREIRLLEACGAAAAAVAVVTVTAVAVGGSDQHPAVTNAKSAAWTVTQSSDGTVSVWFHDYSDPAGLQARLRAAGVRANVDTLTASCYPESTGSGRYGILLVEPSMTQSDVEALFPFTSEKQELSVNPRYLPADATIWIGFPPSTAPVADRFFSVAVQPTDSASAPCPLQVAESNEPGQHGYLVAPGS